MSADVLPPRPSAAGLAVLTTPAQAVLATPWGALIAAVLGLRLLVSLIGALTVVLVSGSGHGLRAQVLLLDPWRHFDAIWFTQIAAHGYASSPLTTAYMPLYPLLIRAVSYLTFGHYLSAALLVSLCSLAVAVGLIWRWVAERFGSGVAWRCIGVLLLYPDAFFLVGAYSEALFLALSAGALLALRYERLPAAGILATLATLTRLQGLVLVVPLGLALWARRKRRDALVPGAAAAALPLLVFVLYERVISTVLHGGGVFDTYSKAWHISLQTPLQTLWQYVSVIRSPRWHLFHSPQYNYILLWDLAIALFSLLVLLVSARRLGPDLTLFGLAGWCFLMTRWYSTGRYMLAVLPLFLALALATGERRRYRWLVTASAALLVFFTAEFAQNSWVD